jgi:predicted RNA-binding protein with PUA-like domain
MKYWLFKSEPDAWSWDQQFAKKIEPWTGVRNYAAALNMKNMECGDLGFFYHSNIGKEIVGIVEVVKEYAPDPTDESGKFGMVEVKAVKPMPKAVTLAEIKATKALANMALVRQSRLSVGPVSAEEWALICKIGAVKA